MRDKDQVELTSRIYEALGVVSLIVAGMVTALAEPIFSMFYPSAYASGASSVPLLFLAPLLLMLYQVAVNQLLVVKKTWPSLVILAIAGTSNVIVCASLVNSLGVEGAAIATLVGYLVANALLILVLFRRGLMAIRVRFFLAVGVFVVYYAVWRTLLQGQTIAMVVAWAVLVLSVLTLYHDDATRFAHSVTREKG